MTSPCAGVFALLVAPIMRVLVPVLHDLVEPAAVQHAPYGANVVDVVAKQSWRERSETLVGDVTVERLVHSEHELGHESLRRGVAGRNGCDSSRSGSAGWRAQSRTARPKAVGD